MQAAVELNVRGLRVATGAEQHEHAFALQALDDARTRTSRSR
jgi:hypothetical protein